MHTNTLNIKTGAPYNVMVGEGLLTACGGLIREVSGARIAAIITDDIVAPLYASEVEHSLESEGFEVVRHVIKNGEQSKCHEALLEIYSFLCKNGITRSDLIVALGGGVVGDLTGFAAATYLRGVAFVQLPTTLLAQVDSSVGGKTAVDIAEGKNLVGTFYQPKLVLCDTATLKTLPPKVFSDGSAEVIKYGAAYDSELLSRLEQGALNTETADIITRCIDIKREVVEQDEFDKGQRAVLNFGHTLAHAIEAESGYTVTHGAAVAVGMALITQASERIGLTQRGTAERLRQCLSLYKLNSETEYSLQTLYPHCLSDKKRAGDSITLVFIREIGSAFLHTVKTEEFKSILY